jgi:hypothetical protein
MRRIRVLICSMDEQTPDEMTELACFDLPATDVTTLQPETALDQLETTTHETGNAILRHLLQTQWETIDTALEAPSDDSNEYAQALIALTTLLGRTGRVTNVVTSDRQTVDTNGAWTTRRRAFARLLWHPMPTRLVANMSGSIKHRQRVYG